MNLKKCLQEAQFHGAKRLADKEFRFLWACSLSLFLLAAVFSVIGAIRRYLDNPTETVQQDLTADLRFPSVSICPEVTYTDEKMDKFMANIKLPQTVNASSIRSVLPELAAFYVRDHPYSVAHLELLETVLTYNGISVQSAVNSLTLTCEEMLLRCRLFSQMKNCSELFTKMLTSYGFCCIFNGRSIEKDLKSNKDATGLDPDLRSKGTGFMNSLVVAVSQLHNTQNFHSLKFKYKWLTVQQPQQYVEASFNGTPLMAQTEHWAEYTASKVLIGEEASKLSDDLLRCRMTYERLRYFPIYKKIYCMAECSMDRVLEKCHCVAMSHPVPPGAVPCKARQLKCVAQAAVMAYSSTECFCPKPCDLTQSLSPIQTFKLVPGTPVVDPFYVDLDLTKVSVVRVYVLHRNTHLLRRRSRYDFTSLFSQLGGTFSVFFGCSILTLAELLQLVWQIFKSWWRRRKGNKRSLAPTTLQRLKKRVADCKRKNKSSWEK